MPSGLEQTANGRGIKLKCNLHLEIFLREAPGEEVFVLSADNSVALFVFAPFFTPPLLFLEMSNL